MLYWILLFSSWFSFYSGALLTNGSWDTNLGRWWVIFLQVAGSRYLTGSFRYNNAGSLFWVVL